MNRPFAPVTLLAGLCLLSGCFGEISWSNHVSFRSYGRGLRISQVDPDEVVVGRISNNLHYVSIAIDAVFFRDLPGLFNRDVVFGLELRGAGDKPIKTVLEVSESVGEHAFLAFDNAVVIQPFLYTGRNIEIILHFKSTAKDNVGNIKGQLQGAGDVLKKINPLADQAINVANNIFSSVIGAFVKKEQSWKYSFTMYPSDSVHRDKPDQLFTAGRHILLSMPPADAPGPYRVLKPITLLKYLGMRGNRLIWAYNEEEFTELPYIILNITRYKRYPNPDTPLRKGVTTLERAIARGDIDFAKAQLKTMSTLIVDDKVITQREKDLERLKLEYQEQRLRAIDAERQQNVDDQLAAMLLQIKNLGDILSGFTTILEPYEVKEFDFIISRLVAHFERISEKAGKPVEKLKELLEAQGGKIARAKRVAKDEELARQALIAKHEIGRQAKTPPPPEVVKAIADVRKAIVRPLRSWWFWTAVGAAAAGTASYFAFFREGGTTPQAPQPPPNVGVSGTLGAPLTAR